MRMFGWIGLLICLPAAFPLVAQGSALRDSAVALYDAGKNAEAQAILLRLAGEGSTDREVHKYLGFALLRSAASQSEAAARKASRARARVAFVRSLALGLDDIQVKALAEAIPEDGGDDAVFSDSPAVDSAMQAAEKAYAAKDWVTAFRFYQKALSLDPEHYEAALYSGDTYLHRAPLDSAYVWYARATAIDPNRETAWRYWSGILLKNGKPMEARDKAVEAIVAEPFNRISYAALQNWAEGTRTQVAPPQVRQPASDSAASRGPAWAAYDSVRRAWRGTTAPGASFRAAFPRDTIYRHSVAEEKAALQAAIRAGSDNPDMANLRVLDAAGMLESYIFFMRTDRDIAGEYPAWRATHRDALRRFWLEFVVGAPLAR